MANATHKSKKYKILLGGGISLVLIGIGIIIYYQFFSQNQETNNTSETNFNTPIKYVMKIPEDSPWKQYISDFTIKFNKTQVFAGEPVGYTASANIINSQGINAIYLVAVMPTENYINYSDAKIIDLLKFKDEQGLVIPLLPNNIPPFTFKNSMTFPVEESTSFHVYIDTSQPLLGTGPEFKRLVPEGGVKSDTVTREIETRFKITCDFPREVFFLVDEPDIQDTVI